jgi:hypothetical protein
MESRQSVQGNHWRPTREGVRPPLCNKPRQTLDRLSGAWSTFPVATSLGATRANRSDPRMSRAAAMQRFTRDLMAALRPSLMPDPRRPGWSES